MSNEKLNYVIQAAIGATFLAKGVGTLAWELLTHLKVVPSKASIEKLIDLVAEKVEAAGKGQAPATRMDLQQTPILG